MRMTELKIGDIVPFAEPRRITGKPLPEPVWHALICPPLKEKAAAGILNKNGVRCFFPREKRKRVHQGKVRVLKHPQVTRIIYAKFKHRPNWHVLRERGIITGVFCVGNRPVVLGVDIIRAVQGLPTTAERLAKAKRQLMVAAPGDRVEILDGPFEGFCVDVTKAENGRIWWAYVNDYGLQIRGECDQTEVVKQNVV